MSAMLRVFKNKWITPPKAVDEDYSGRIIIVTGATSGIGVEAAFKFAALGAAKVIMTARDSQKGERVKAELTSRLGRDGQLEVWELDMMDYGSVAAFARRAEQLDHIDIVVLNAGARRRSLVRSQYGWEEDLQVNTLSTTLLAIFLLPKLRASKRQTGRTPIVEFVNSGLHQNAVVPSPVQQEASILQHYNKHENFKEGSQYKFSKVFLMYATNKLADEINSGDVIVTSICPGWVNTNLGRDRFFPGVFVLAFVFILLFMRTSSQGANTIMSVTTRGERVHGRFYQHDVVQPVPPSVAGPEMKALGLRVWEEIVEALKKDVPDFAPALVAAFPRK
ncbi:short-chain dehydrogenase/reductase family protein-like protein [Plenodomus tracheiphilus IPT5]|uniref:Short-chain dehydrogenase/reductase family protein-like protein n=1 Tax=Plenodomus tracheiphilus IPT5 TaxID=1408161 RepID=A0A6A7B188_9PLEO|nr:short-chain dehydrogenase/reductase family protein-like protein [Plenodomus tracheiphilus IPT5]